VAETGLDEILDQTITVRFDASKRATCPWEFRPGGARDGIRIGETGLAFYEAYNPTDRTHRRHGELQRRPLRGGRLFVKIACFCFEEQVLQPGERVEMPVTFYVDPEIVTIGTRNTSRTITLSYTFYVIDLPEELCRRSTRVRPANNELTTNRGTAPMAHAKNHDYHILNPSIWPLIGAVGAFAMLFGAVLWMHGNGPLAVPDGLRRRVLYVMFGWWADVVKESQAGRSHAGGAHRPALRLHHVHHVRGDVLRGVVLELLQARHLPDEHLRGIEPGGTSGRPGDRDLRPLAPAADQHADPAAVGLRGDLGAPRAGA
jgi:cytochrome c oxidase assembly protein Cox11